MSRILWTLPYLPWPITSGGKARQFHLLSRLAQRGHAITLLVQSKTDADESVHAALSPLLDRLIVLPRRALRHPRTLCAVALSPLPLLATVNGYSPRLEQTFAKLLDETWDVIQIEHSYGAQPFLAQLDQRRRPFVLTEHNVESALGAATYGKWPLPLRPLGAYDRWRAKRWERHVLQRAERVVAVTNSDAQTLAALSGRPTDVVGNGVDVAAFDEVVPAVHAARVMFVGNFEYAPNIDALEWALSEILPQVWQQHPAMRFVVCGYALPERFQHMHDDPRIEWHGYVPRLQDVQRDCSAFLAPLRQGGGSKLKVMEALAAGLPVVSTREGVSGIAVRASEDAVIADGASALAAGLCGLLADPQRGRRIGEAGRRLVRDRHDWGVAASELEAVYERLGRSGSMPSQQGQACA